MSAQESIAAALSVCTCPTTYATYEGPEEDCPLHGTPETRAAAAMDAARAAVVALPEGRAEIHGGWVRFVDRAAVLDLLTPATPPEGTR